MRSERWVGVASWLVWMLLDGVTQVPQDILTYILQESNNLEGIKDFDLEDMVDEFCYLLSELVSFFVHHLAFLILIIN